MTNINSLNSESLISTILQAIAKVEMPKTLDVQQNAVVTGRMHEHQADIYWEFTDGAIIYRTLINAHDWQKTASTADLFNLLAELRDIPGQTTGVLFTQPIYQKDVRKLANEAGIVLYELPIPDDTVFWQPLVSNPKINVDTEWAKTEKERLGKIDETIQFGGNPKYLFIYDNDGNCIDTVQGIIDSHAKKRHITAQDKEHITHSFDQSAFLQTDNEFFPRVKLESIAFELEFIDPNAIQGEDMVRYILENILNFFGR